MELPTTSTSRTMNEKNSTQMTMAMTMHCSQSYMSDRTERGAFSAFTFSFMPSINS